MTLIDLQGKVLYSGDKEVKKAYLGGNVFYSLGPIEPGQFQIPGMYGANTLSSSINKYSLIGYTLNNNTYTYTNFALFDTTWFTLAGTPPSQFYTPRIVTSHKTKSGGSINLGMQEGYAFKVYYPSAAGNYVLKYDAKTFVGETNAGYFSKTNDATDNIGSYQTYTTEWASYYEPPVNMPDTTTDYIFHMRLQREPGNLGRVQFANFEFIPADLL